MKQWQEIRHRVLKQGVSKRQILRETGMHWQTLEKILEHSSPSGYRRATPVRKPKIGPWLGRIVEMLKEDQAKQYHTAKRIWQRLQQEGFTGGYTIVKDAVREIKKHHQEIFMPLRHRPGEAQVDFGFALVKMAGVCKRRSESAAGGGAKPRHPGPIYPAHGGMSNNFLLQHIHTRTAHAIRVDTITFPGVSSAAESPSGDNFHHWLPEYAHGGSGGPAALP